MKRIFVGISGGVDSSVAAFLLKEQGYDVQGIFVKTWAPDWVPCTWVDEKRDAMRICAALDIPFHFLDANEEYKQGVADYMISEYKLGRTPNPDVLCNKVIKFGAMWKYAKEHGATGIATGHYAQVKDGKLYKGMDAAKDQAYFLWMIEKDLLPQIQFPIGHLQKKEVRAIAEKAGLFTATKKDSQGICFLGEVDMKDFLRHYIDEQPGVVLNEEGKIVGEHDGVWFYTLGERHGFRITEKDTNRTPYYIIAKDVEANTITVARTVHSQKNTSGKVTVNLRDTNWFIDPEQGTAYTAQIRYHGTLLKAEVLNDKTILLEGDEAIPLGQSLLVYKDDIVIGGGVIDFLS
ncbi:MAG: tRNA (5-methylaminomethyl-2-thiouridylate)-methyltransferase, tRNA-specific 2-thiouridylase [Candidatus Nomurabacteria bacterium]|nr:tRNA (5-methylaminomethyl-2-thiouridylate)-methyltransferase, tRNA-specific 2-thiouridylase [Candidatus Nomurabacteria bacterium]